MSVRLALAIVALGLSAPARAQFQVTGGGGVVPAFGTGGGGNSYDMLPAHWSEFPLSTPVPSGGGSISAVRLSGLSHSWAGDLHVVLQEPTGIGHNLIVRLGVAAPASCCGHSVNFNGDYTIVAAGDPSIDQAWPSANPGGGVDLRVGTYPQEHGALWGSGWLDGAQGVYNTDLHSIPAVPGIWSLFIYDGSGGSTGSLAAWTLEGTSGLGTTFCPALPNSMGRPGVISAIGSPSVGANDLILAATDLPPNAFVMFVTSRLQTVMPNPNGSAGILCIGGGLGRYDDPGQVSNSGHTGSVRLVADLTQHPIPFAHIAVQPGETWHFQAWHRDTAAGFPSSNFTQGLSIQFVP